MKILSNYNKTNLLNSNNNKPVICHFVNNAKTDSVNFGKKPPVELVLSPIEEAGLKVAKNLMKLQRNNSLNLQTITRTLNEFSPVPVIVKPLSELPAQIQSMSPDKIGAHMLPLYSPNMDLIETEVYLGNATNAKEAGKLISDTAHEFAHILQRHGDKSYFGIRQYTEDINEVTTLIRISQTIYNQLISNCNNALINSEKFQRAVKSMKTSSPEVIARYLEQQNVSKSLSETVDSISDFIMLMPQVDILKRNNNLDTKTIKKIIVKSIIKQAQMEEEAYNTTLASLRKWGKVDERNLLDKQIIRDINHIIANNLTI